MTERLLQPRPQGASCTGTLSGADNKHNLVHNFDLPQGVAELRVRMTFSPHVVAGFKNMIPLSLFDPAGFRGAKHCHGTTHEIALSAQAASPGYLAGPLPAGRWQVVLDAHVVMSEEPVHYGIEVDFAPTPSLAPQRWAAGPAPQRGPGWYRGDLHAHTTHSDAAWDVPELVAWARQQRLDFVTLSDHNTLSGIPHLRALQGPDLLTLGGMEFTTFWGHALMLGVSDWMDWRTENAVGMAAISRRVQARGGIFIVAHPRAIGDPYCSGCRWMYDEVFPGPARMVEVWNADWGGDSNNADGLALAFDWLNQGYRMAFTSGTDNHGRVPGLHHGFNHVYAEALTETALLAALQAGHNYISAGPRLTIEARRGTDVVGMGDVLPVGQGRAEVEFAWAHAPASAQLTVYGGKAIRHQGSVPAAGTLRLALDPAEVAWVSATLTERDGRMQALTNPVFLNPPAR